MRRLTAVITFISAIFLPNNVAAQQLFDTGVGADGAVLPVGTRDPHWFFAQGAQTNPSTGEQSYVVPISPLATLPPWVNPGSSAWWISMLPNGHLHAPDGITTFFTRFVLPSNLLSATLFGRLASDNQAEIFINGNSVFYNNSAFNRFTTFTISSGFQPGENTLLVQLNNDPNNALNPAALVMSDLSVESTVTPEPATITLLVSGMAGIAAARRRKRNGSGGDDGPTI